LCGSAKREVHRTTDEIAWPQAFVRERVSAR